MGGSDQSCDKTLGFFGSGDLVVVVDDEPAVARPGREVLIRDLRKNVDLRGGARECPQMLAQAHLAVGHELGSSSRQPERQGCHIGRRPARRGPFPPAASGIDPLLGQNSLPVTAGATSVSHGRRFVQQAKRRAA